MPIFAHRLSASETANVKVASSDWAFFGQLEGLNANNDGVFMESLRDDGRKKDGLKEGSKLASKSCWKSWN